MLRQLVLVITSQSCWCSCVHQSSCSLKTPPRELHKQLRIPLPKMHCSSERRGLLPRHLCAMLLPDPAFVPQSAPVPQVLSDMHTAVYNLSLSVHQRSADSTVFRPDDLKWSARWCRAKWDVIHNIQPLHVAFHPPFPWHSSHNTAVVPVTRSLKWMLMC